MTPIEPDEPRDTEPARTSDPEGPGDTVADPPPTESADPAAGPAATPAGAARGRVELPTDVDAAFAAIVAGWTDETPRWPSDDDEEENDGPAPGERPSGVGLATPPGGTPEAPRPPTASRPAPDDAPATGGSGGPTGTGGTARPRGPRDHEPPVVDEHFVPPEPPPLPRLGMSSLLGLLLLVVGVVLLAVPGIVGASVGLGIVPGLLAMTAGLGWLVLGMRRSSERDGDGPDADGEL